MPAGMKKSSYQGSKMEGERGERGIQLGGTTKQTGMEKVLIFNVGGIAPLLCHFPTLSGLPN